MPPSIARVLAAVLFLAFALPAAAARKPALGLTLEQREARDRLKEGDRLMKDEAFLEAIAAYEEAERLDPLLMLAPYGIGRARMSLRDYPAAIDAFLRAETAFVNLQQAGADIRRAMGEARDDRMRIVSDAMRETESQLSSVNPTSRLARRLNERLRALDVEYDALEQQKAQATVGGGGRMPPSLSLALGSAYFRAGRLADAEREYKAALAADPKLGEARNNLAVVYFETGRASEAMHEIELAEQAGFHVHPQLKQAVSRTLN